MQIKCSVVRCTRHNLIWSSFSVTSSRLVVLYRFPSPIKLNPEIQPTYCTKWCSINRWLCYRELWFFRNCCHETSAFIYDLLNTNIQLEAHTSLNLKHFICIKSSKWDWTQVATRFVHGEVYSIQHYVIKFVSDLRQVGGFLPFWYVFYVAIKTAARDLVLHGIVSQWRTRRIIGSYTSPYWRSGISLTSGRNPRSSIRTSASTCFFHFNIKTKHVDFIHSFACQCHVSSKTDYHNITEILLKVALNSIKQTIFNFCYYYSIL
jgi:hypothetical protein